MPAKDYTIAFKLLIIELSRGKKGAEYKTV